MFDRFTGVFLSFILLAGVSFGLSQWLHIPIGNLQYWGVGIGIFTWLLTIVILPWNIHFSARKVVDEAALSLERGIVVAPDRVAFAQKVMNYALIIAVVAHLGTALLLYLLAKYQVGTIGYIGAIAAILLTFLRPSFRFYEYLSARLFSLAEEVICPRNDAISLQQTIEVLSQKTDRLAEELNPENPLSSIVYNRKSLEALQTQLAELSASHRLSVAQNQQEHDRISLEARQAIAQLNADSEFLDRVREIIRFYKSV